MFRLIFSLYCLKFQFTIGSGILGALLVCRNSSHVGGSNSFECRPLQLVSNDDRLKAGGVRTGIALHSGSDIFNMVAEVS